MRRYQILWLVSDLFPRSPARPPRPPV